MTFSAISTPCSLPGRLGRTPAHLVLALLLTCASLVPLSAAAAAQDGEMIGVRGDLFVSPAFGFVVMAPATSGWVFEESWSDADGDFIQASHPSGVVEIVAGFQDPEVDAEGCVQGLLDGLASSYPDAALTGWDGNDLSILADSPDAASVQALVPNSAGDNLFTYISCNRHPGDLLLADMQLQPESMLGSNDTPMPLLVQPPGRENTGLPAQDDAIPASGVVLFAARGLPIFEGETSLPFSCLDQESFGMPEDELAEGMGYFACDGQVANVDTQPVTIDLAGFALGCLPGLAVDPDAGACPDEPVRASHAQVLDTSTGSVDGMTVTLEPGEYADLVLWFTLPEGLPPQDVLYIDGGQTFQAGPTYFAAGIGSRPRVRMTR